MPYSGLGTLFKWTKGYHYLEKMYKSDSWVDAHKTNPLHTQMANVNTAYSSLTGTAMYSHSQIKAR